jgi:hypothetical protein
MVSDVISIKVMNSIFKESGFKLSHSSMQLYQNILQYYFSDKEETINNLNEFELKYKEIPNYKKFENQFKELQQANLIELNKSSILFKNAWQIHLNLARMTSIRNDKRLASDYMLIMSESQQLIEAVAMKLKIKREEVAQLLKMFFTEQDGIGKTYSNESECRKHFIYWSQSNQSKIVKNQVISKSKILGIK